MKVILISIEASPSIYFNILQEILQQDGHDGKYLHIDPKENISREILRDFCKDADVVCVSCMTNTFLRFAEISKKIKGIKAKIIVGGVHPTVKPDECLDFADYICIGEGEYVIPNILKKLEKGEKINKIIKEQKMVEDLNKLPIPKFKLDNLYFYYGGKINKLSKNRNMIGQYFNKYYYIITSRGCPFLCKYCLNHCLVKLNKNFIKVRRRNHEHIIKELENIKKIVPKNTIIGIVDDDFCSRPYEDLKKLCEKYKKRIGLPFFCSTSPSSISEEKLITLIDAGLIRLEVGIQSISDYVNKEIYGRYIPKKITLAKIKMLEKYLKKLEVCFDIILDNPWESDETKIETLNFILDLKYPKNVWLFSLTLYPGTDLYDRAKGEGKIKNEIKEIYMNNHTLLKNNYINTLFVLHLKYGVKKSIIKFLLKHNKSPIIKYFLNKGTHLLLRIYNYYIGLLDSIKRRDRAKRNYYLKAPFKKILNLIKNGR